MENKTDPASTITQRLYEHKYAQPVKDSLGRRTLLDGYYLMVSDGNNQLYGFPIKQAPGVEGLIDGDRPAEGRPARRASSARPRSVSEGPARKSFLLREEGRQAGEESRASRLRKPGGLRTDQALERPRKAGPRKGR